MTEGEEPTPIAVALGSWLPISETFIYDQLRHQRRYVGHVLARDRVPTCTLFPYTHVTALSPLERAQWELLGRSRSFEAACQGAKVQLIHAHFGPNGAMALGLSAALKVPLVVTFHGHDVAGLLPKNRFTARYFLYQRAREELFSRAALLLCVSRELERMLLELGAPRERTFVHRLGVDLGRFALSPLREGPRRILMVGRLVEKKGMAYGIQAFAKICRDFGDLTLRIVGHGPLAVSLKRLVVELGVEDRVSFLGALPTDEVRTELEQAYAVLAPSVVAQNGDMEGSPVVLREVAACGRPAISTWHSGIPEVIRDEETGYLVRERDVNALSERLAELLRDRDLAARLGRQARAKMEREYDTVQCNGALEEHFAAVINGMK